ncbi:MAG: MBOAT family protein [Lachnospiraceae bacterium]|nr:MBOAT family protein [Lachnospiraceae bacterium]
MLFNSLEFLIFLPIVLLVTFILPKKIRYIWLLIASYYFYMCWNAVYGLLILFSTLVTYLGGVGIEWCKGQPWEETKITRGKKLCVGVGFGLNIGVLCYFKYTNFLLDNLRDFFHLLHIELNIPEVDILLPVGISFFTFQALSYLMDVYRDDIYAEKNFFRYALFVSFFPQLVAGPIERSKNLLKQLATPPKFDADNIREGLWLMVYGYFLKVVLADRTAIFVDTVYGNHGNYQGLYVVIAAILFSIQVYCDFYGYSVIAMGTAKLLGYRLMDNFNAPFYSRSVSELWRRWHISLNSWFKDYLYIPLGGSRKGKVRSYVNRVIVFFVSGLWHGANWTYVVWGMMNGAYQMIGEALMPLRNKMVKLLGLNRESASHKIMQTVVTFSLFAFSTIFFRASSIGVAFEMIKNMISTWNPWIFVNGGIYSCGVEQKNFTVMLISIGILFVSDFFKYRGVCIRKEIMKQEWWFRWLLMAGSVVLIVVFGVWGSAYNAGNFIYFQF